MAPPSPGEALTLEQTARVVGGHVWVEMRLFELLGAWVPEIPEPEVKLALAPHAHHHAWHAELWHARLPFFGAHTEDSLVVPNGAAWARLVDAVGEPQGPSATLEKLVGVYQVVLPRKIRTYRAHLARTDPVADASVIRVLRLALDDEVEHWAQGLGLVDRLLENRDALARAAAHRAHLEHLAFDLVDD